mmetsp:Transcript_1316/g.2182  ORF Transcript_1316/g.2182 Transcript_1316/m.2182 type:complete len:86 (-) Transcript_1316:395-652(-)
MAGTEVKVDDDDEERRSKELRRMPHSPSSDSSAPRMRYGRRLPRTSGTNDSKQPPIPPLSFFDLDLLLCATTNRSLNAPIRGQIN